MNLLNVDAIMISIIKRIMRKSGIAIDLGTANTRIYSHEGQMIAEEPTIVSRVRPGNGTPKGDEYIAYLNSKLVSCPLKGGVIVDLETAVSLLKPLFKRARRGFRQPVSLACAPSNSTDRERQILVEAIRHAGGAQVAIIPETWAAALGAGLDVYGPRAQMLIDLGDGVTDMAVFRDGRLIYARAIRTACSDLQKAIKTAAINRYRVCPYTEDVQKLTNEIDSAAEENGSQNGFLPVKGIDVGRGKEASFAMSRQEVVRAMEPTLSRILGMIEMGLRNLPEKVFREVQMSGICLSGGGSCIKGMDRLIAARTQLTVNIAPEPMHAVIRGAGQTLLSWGENGAWQEKTTWPIFSSF